MDNDPNYIIKLADDLKAEQEKNMQLESYKQEAQPKIDIYDKFLSAVNYQSMNDAAKTLNVGRNTMFAFLRKIGVFMKNNTPYQKYINQGYFIVRMVPTRDGKRIIDVPTTYVSAKGMVWLEKVYANGGLLKRKKSA
jgi:phage antirepressor YoqD-like protein